MCKDDDRVIESLVSQINDLQEELRKYSTPEGIPEGLNEAEVLAIADIYRYFLRLNCRFLPVHGIHSALIHPERLLPWCSISALSLQRNGIVPCLAKQNS